MLLSQLVDKPLYVGNSVRGYCRGVGLSLKSYSVKYLLCASAPTLRSADFAVSAASAVCEQDGIQLSRLRSVFPKSCARIFLGLPVFSVDGAFLGNLSDIELDGLSAVAIHTTRNACFPVSAIAACSDAVLLRKEQVYPLGQRIPAPFLSLNCHLVTKQVLRQAIQEKSLIKLTLSLPPFNVTTSDVK